MNKVITKLDNIIIIKFKFIKILRTKIKPLKHKIKK